MSCLFFSCGNFWWIVVLLRLPCCSLMASLLSYLWLPCGGAVPFHVISEMSISYFRKRHFQSVSHCYSSLFPRAERFEKTRGAQSKNSRLELDSFNIWLAVVWRSRLKEMTVPPNADLPSNTWARESHRT